MYRAHDSLEQGLVTPPSPFAPTPATRRKPFNFRPEMMVDRQPQHFPYAPPSLRALPPAAGDRASGGCLSRAPFASLCAFLCCLFGVLLFGTMMAWTFTASVEQTRRALRVNNLPWLDKVHLLFVVSACAMFAVSLAFLLIGVLSTGPTRHAVFNSGGDAAAIAARRGGRISCVVAICLSFVLNLLWTTIAMFTAILCFIYTILYFLCSSPNDCLDFGVFGPLLDKQNDSLKFCGGELQQFCAVTNTVVVWNFVGLLGSVIVCIGLVQFIASNAANYAHIGSEAKYAELKHLFNSEMNDGCSNSSSLSQKMALMKQFSSSSSGHDDEHHHNNNHFQQSWQRRPSFSTNCNGGARRRESSNSGGRWEKTESAAEQLHQQLQQNGSRKTTNAAKPSPPYEYQRRQPKSERRAEKRSVGAAVGSVRRNSYQNSLHGSNNWLNYDAPAPWGMDNAADYTVGRRVGY